MRKHVMFHAKGFFFVCGCVCTHCIYLYHTKLYYFELVCIFDIKNINTRSKSHIIKKNKYILLKISGHRSHHVALITTGWFSATAIKNTQGQSFGKCQNFFFFY